MSLGYLTTAATQANVNQITTTVVTSPVTVPVTTVCTTSCYCPRGATCTCTCITNTTLTTTTIYETTTIQPFVTLSPTSGPPGTNVAFAGFHFASSDTGCTTSSSPSGLFSASSCTPVPGVIEISGSFTVASGASGGVYMVTVIGSSGDSAAASFTVTQTSTVLSTTVSTVVTSGTTATVAGLQMQVVSNSTVSGLVFDSTRGLLNFTVSGPAGTSGFFDATVAKTLLSGQPVVLIDGVQTSATVSGETNFWYIHVTYPHSQHHVTIGGSNTVPEFPSVLLLAIIIAVALAIFRRRLTQLESHAAASSH